MEKNFVIPPAHFLRNGFEKNGEYLSYRKLVLSGDLTLTYVVASLDGDVWIEIESTRKDLNGQSIQSAVFRFESIDEFDKFISSLIRKSKEPNSAHSFTEGSEESQSYYPLRVGTHSSCIVSDTMPKRSNSDPTEAKHYGGYLIAESVPSKELAQQLVDAYNEKYQYATPSATEEEDAKYRDLGLMYPKNMANGVWSKDINAFKEKQDKFETQFPGVDNKSPYEKPSIDRQIEFMKDHLHDTYEPDDAPYKAIIENLIAIKRFNQSPALHNVDVEKVIKDLKENLDICLRVTEISRKREDIANSAIQNAEAALGMLQAFKSRRDMTYRDVQDANHARAEALAEKYTNDWLSNLSLRTEEEVTQKLGQLLDDKSPLVKAQAIMDAIDSMIKLRSNGK